MKSGDYVKTASFRTVRVTEVFESKAAAQKAGYTEQALYLSRKYGILGRRVDRYRMTFAAYKKR